MKLGMFAPRQMVDFVKQSRDELKKVQWPTRQQTLRYTVIVVVASLAISFLTGGVDYLLAFILERFIL